MNANVLVGSYHCLDGCSGVSYMVFDEDERCIAANAIAIKENDILRCGFKAVDFVVKGMRYIYADTVCINMSNLSVVSCLNGAIKPPKGCEGWITDIQHRASFLPCAMYFKWARIEDLQLVNTLARLIIGSNNY